MSNDKFKNKYRIKSTRATWHDYNGGAYFITVCTKNMEHFFGEIETEGNAGRDVETGRGVETGRAPSLRATHTTHTTHTPHALRAPFLQMTKIGQFLYDNLKNVTVHYPYAEIPLFVVMPNHWHGIVFIDGKKTPYVRRDVGMRDVETGRGVETGRAPSLRDNNKQTPTNEKMRQIDSFKGWLSVTIGGIKSAVTKFARDNDIDFAWQTQFHDRIIRDKDAMNRIVDYIENNPARWDTDCYKINENGK